MSVSIGRVSTLQLAQVNRDYISRTTAELQKVSQEVSTGRIADAYRDLGPQAATSMFLRAREAETQTFITSNNLLQGRLQVQLESIEAVRDQVNGVLEPLLANVSTPLAGAETLQIQAKTALEITISQLNVSYGGQSLFGGTESGQSPLVQFDDVNPTTGLSPQDVIRSIIPNPPTSIAEIQTIMAELDAVFSSSATNPNENFEASFYQGTAALSALGDPNARLSARIEPGMDIDYGVQANDAPFREVYKGLAMLAAFDVTEISDPSVYIAWMDEVTGVLGDATLDVLTVSTEIGFRQQIVETAQRRLEATSAVNRTQLAQLEEVDVYEATTRLTALDVQLRTSYEVTAQLNSLSLLNYL